MSIRETTDGPAMHKNARQMHLGVFVLATGNHYSGWRIPGAVTSAEDLPAIIEIAKAAERGKYDFIFFADTLNCILENHPGYLAKFEPVTLLAAQSTQTSRIGLVATISTTFTEPYNLARFVASVDKMSGGRVGWNVVTSTNELTAANFGREMPAHDDRYEIATEYLEVVQGLWDSWEEGGIVARRETGQYADAAKLHTLDHQGKYFSVRGPLSNTRSPQGQPVIFQAGSSRAGQQFAARYAEIVFTVQQDPTEARSFRTGLQSQVMAGGRSPQHCKVLPGLFPVVGRTEEEARRKFAELAQYVDPGSAMMVMSQRYGHDLSQYPMDGPVPELPPSEKGNQGYAHVLLAKARRENMTLKDLHDLFALSRGYIMLIGTPKTVADTMEEWFLAGACDGFMITPSHFPQALNDFTELVVPELQSRGLFRADYQGSTLRSHLGLPEPVNRFSACGK
jgi:N-acetyl-S-(2-succino)cysteine monooxygenase